MSFDHSLSGYAMLRKEVDLDGAIEVVTPLFGYFGLENGAIRAVLLGESNGPSGTEARFNKDTSELYFYTSGSVNSAFDDVIKETVRRLNGAADTAGTLTLKDYDTADLENAVTHFWFGPSEQSIMDGKFNNNLTIATALLAEVLGNDEAYRLAAEARIVYAAQRAAKQ